MVPSCKGLNVFFSKRLFLSLTEKVKRLEPFDWRFLHQEAHALLCRKTRVYTLHVKEETVSIYLAAHFVEKQTSFCCFEPETRGVCNYNLLAITCLSIIALQEDL